MDFDYFDEPGDTVIEPNNPDNSNQQPQTTQNEDDEFNFGQSQQAPQMAFDSYGTDQIPSYNASTPYTNMEEEDQNIKRMREEEERIQEELREKSNKQYELKQQRREQARVQLQDFMEQKEREKQERKQANKTREEQLLQAKQNNETETNWRKVALNVALKQGERVGKKDVNRMREAIINKKNDQCT